MSIREIDSYTQHALGRGCFFNRHDQQMVNKPGGGRRRERVFTSDRTIQHPESGVVEFGELAAAEIAHLLGWVNPDLFENTVETNNTLSLEAGELNARLMEQAEALKVLTKMLAEKDAELAAKEEERAAIASSLASAHGKLSGEKRAREKAEKDLRKATNYGSTS